MFLMYFDVLNQNLQRHQIFSFITHRFCENCEKMAKNHINESEKKSQKITKKEKKLEIMNRKKS